MLTISTAAEDLARVYDWLDHWGHTRDLPKRMLHAMHVALEETVMNAAIHGFPPGHRGEITILPLLSEAAAELVIEDTGRAFDPTRAAPAQSSPGALSGRGLTLLRHFCPDIRYERAGERNRLTLRFPLPSE